MIKVTPVPAFRDNYIWVLHDDTDAVAVDPGDAAPLEDYLTREGLTLAAILVTHHHADHVGGLPALTARRAIPVYGPQREQIDGLTQRLIEGDEVRIGKPGLHFRVIEIPGHTAGHIAYVGAGMVLCGDTLFACGCGRLFEGTPAQMHDSLAKLAALPGDTRVYCTHEYTLANIRFARAVEPESSALAAREQHEQAKRTAGMPTLPSTIALERATNPFLRSHEPAVVASAVRRSGHMPRDAVETFAILREWKNQF